MSYAKIATHKIDMVMGGHLGFQMILCFTEGFTGHGLSQLLHRVMKVSSEPLRKASYNLSAPVCSADWKLCVCSSEVQIQRSPWKDTPHLPLHHLPLLQL